MKTFLKFGIATGLSVSLWLFISFIFIRAFGVSPEMSRALSGLFSILILILGIFLGLREIKTKNSGTPVQNCSANRNKNIVCNCRYGLTL